jgi:hypothetical protein
MPASFLVCTENCHIQDIEIKKFHLNLWQINSNYLRSEIGLLFSVSKEELQKHNDIKFNLFTAFPIQKGSLTVVYQNLLNDSNISLLFNEKCQNITDCTLPENLSYANSITLGNKDNFILINTEIITNECEKKKIVFTVIPKNIDFQNIGQKISIYVRFFYKICLEGCDNILKKYTLTNDFIIYDIRLRDLRLFESNNLKDRYDKIIPVKQFYVFIINEVCFKPRLIDNINFEYRRMLEKDLFKSYVKELNKTIKRYIIHFWKFDIKKETANLVVSFEKEKSFRILSIYALTMNIVVAFLFSFSDSSFKLKDFIPILSGIIMFYIILLFFPYVFRNIINKFWISKANKKN